MAHLEEDEAGAADVEDVVELLCRADNEGTGIGICGALQELRQLVDISVAVLQHRIQLVKTAVLEGFLQRVGLVLVEPALPRVVRRALVGHGDGQQVVVLPVGKPHHGVLAALQKSFQQFVIVCAALVVRCQLVKERLTQHGQQVLVLALRDGRSQRTERAGDVHGEELLELLRLGVVLGFKKSRCHNYANFSSVDFPLSRVVSMMLR